MLCHVISDVHTVMPLRNNRVVIAADSSAGIPLLLVYSYRTGLFEQALPFYHREAIHHVMPLQSPVTVTGSLSSVTPSAGTRSPQHHGAASDEAQHHLSVSRAVSSSTTASQHSLQSRADLNDMNFRFASGSNDGIITVWRDGLVDARSGVAKVQALFTLNFHETYVSRKTKQLAFAVHSLRMVPRSSADSSRPFALLAAAIGCGFSIFDVTVGRAVVTNEAAHDCDVTDIACLDSRTVVTCAIDGSACVWDLTVSLTQYANAKGTQSWFRKCIARASLICFS